MMTTEKGGRTERRIAKQEVYLGGMCPRCEGMGKVNDIDRTALYDEDKSLSDGALTVPGYSMDGLVRPAVRGHGPADGQADQVVHQEAARDDAVVRADQAQGRGRQPHLHRDHPADPEVDAVQGPRGDAAARAPVRRARGHVPDVPGLRGHPAHAGGTGSKIRGRSIADLCEMQISDLAEWVRALEEPSVAPLLAGLQHLLDSFAEIGLGYLSLDRPAGTLSGGEAQRTKMIRHLGSSLTDVTYVFDEPTIGLHPHDIQRMNVLLLQLRDKGNTVLVVEHKPETIAIADHVVDLGPGAGSGGGEICFEGDVDGLRSSSTITGQAPRRPCAGQGRGAVVLRDDRGPRGRHPQPQGRRRRPPARGAHRGHRGRRVRQELADPRLARRPRRRHPHRPGRHQGFTAQQPGDVHGSAGADPQGVRQGERSETRSVQRELRGRLRRLQRSGRDLHRAGPDGHRRVPVRGVRGPPVQGGGAGAHPRRQGHRRGPRDVGRRRARALRHRRGEDPRRRDDPRAPRRRRARLHHPRAAAHHAVRRRAAAAQAGGPDGRQGRRVRPRRALDRSAPRRRREPARSARPARRHRQVRHRDRAPPGRDGARRLDHRPRSGRRPRRRQRRLRGHARRPGRRPVDADRPAPGGVRRAGR